MLHSERPPPATHMREGKNCPEAGNRALRVEIFEDGEQYIVVELVYMRVVTLMVYQVHWRLHGRGLVVTVRKYVVVAVSEWKKQGGNHSSVQKFKLEMKLLSLPSSPKTRFQ